MKKDWRTLSVKQMDADEVVLFALYRNQVSAPGGLSGDQLPYTQQFDRLRDEYNQRIGVELSSCEFWEKLKTVLKPGEARIEEYLRANNIDFPPK